MDLKLYDLLNMLKPSMLASCVMLASILVIRSLAAPMNVVILISTVLTGAGIYFVLFYIFDKKAFLEIKQLVFSWS